MASIDNLKLQKEVQDLRRELEDLKKNRFQNMSMNDIESIKNVLFDRQAATLASGAVLNYEIVTIRGKRRVVPTYDRFTPLV